MIDKVLAYLFAAFSIAYLIFARELSVGTAAAPKAGFLPLLSGLTATILAFVIIVRQFLSAPQQAGEAVNWRKFLMVVVGLIFYIVLLYIAGYIVATFITVFYLLKVADTVGWVFTSLMSAVITASFYAIFVKLLGITLP